MGFVFTDCDGQEELHLSDEWFDDFNDVFESIDKEDAVNEMDMQIDNRMFEIE